MKYCIRVPRLILPRAGLEKFACPAPDCRAQDRAFWAKTEREIGENVSALNFILPEVYIGEEDEVRAQAVRESQYEALESDKLEKLARGGVYVERTLPSGAVRRGVVLTIDLEEFSYRRGKSSSARASEETDPVRVAAYKLLRKTAPLEFPSAVFAYRDKKERLPRLLKGEKLEELYRCDLPCGGGKIVGSFLPEDLAEDAADLLHAKGEPRFVAVEGNDALAAAKEHWEEVKKGITPSEQICHPARFMLAEFINLYEDSVQFFPVHRLLEDCDREAAADYLSRSIKCKREGNILIPSLPAGGEGTKKIDALLSSYLRANGGKLLRVSGTERLKTLSAEEDCLGIALKAPEKEDLFDDMKDGNLYPAGTFTLGENSKRFCFEGRETSYD